MAETYDLVVIGTGMAGGVVAQKCRAAGWSVVIVDELPYGGTCPLRGCDPKKVLVGLAEAIDWLDRKRETGLRAEFQVDWGALQRFKRTFTDPFPERRERSFAEAGIQTLHGRASFADPSTLRVGDELIGARHVLIATGAEPMPLGFEGEEHLLTSDRFLELEELPRDIAFIGGGFISFELAHVAARAGARCRILEMAPRPLGPFDPDLVGRLVEATRALSIDVHTATRVRRVERRAADRFAVHTEGRAGEESFEAAAVVHGAGRRPRLDPLQLERGEVERSERGVLVNEHLQSTSNPRVYAAGDAAGVDPQLTPVAVRHGHVVAKNLLEGNVQAVDSRGIPGVVFTVPPLAAVGLTEQEARERGLAVRVEQELDTSGWFTSRRIGERWSGFKVVIEEGSEQVLGAHILGHNADEVVNLFAVAIQAGIPAGRLRQMGLAYPTAGSDVPYML